MPESAPTRGRRVLVADDDPVSLRFLDGALRELGCVPTVVSDGHAAIVAADRERFDLLLLDRRMPGKGGAELLFALRRGGVEAPAIATSAELDPATRAELSSAGYLDALLKPIGVEALARAVATLELDSGASGAVAAPKGRLGPCQHDGQAADTTAADEQALLDDDAGRQAVGGDVATLAALRALLAGELGTLMLERPSDPDAFADLLHRLRAACRYCGATRLERIADAMEEGVRAGTSAAPSRLSEFLACCAETKHAILKSAAG